MASRAASTRSSQSGKPRSHSPSPSQASFASVKAHTWEAPSKKSARAASVGTIGMNLLFFNFSLQGHHLGHVVRGSQP